MKLTINQKTLATALEIVGKVVTNTATHPMLCGVVITATLDGRVDFYATDLTMYVAKTVQAQVEIAGKTILPYRVLHDYIKSCKGDLTLAVDGEMAVIRQGDNEFKIQTMVGDYPDFVTVKTEPAFHLNGYDLKEVINKCSVCAATDDARPMLRGINFEIADNKLTAVTLDGFRLAKVIKECKNMTLNMRYDYTIPAKELNQISKLLPVNSDIGIAIENKFASVQFDCIVWAIRLLDGEYINYSQIIPPSFTGQMTASSDALQTAISRASILEDNKNRVVTLDIKGDSLAVTSRNEIGNILEKVEAQSTQETTIHFNAKYLLDILKVAGSKTVILYYNEPLMPCVIRGESEGAMFLVLPMNR